MRNTLALLVVLGLGSPGWGQCPRQNTAFAPGEVLNYEVFYNLGMVWLNAGYVTFKVTEKQYRQRVAYHFDAYGATYPKYDWIYKVRDHYQAYFDRDQFCPLWFHRENYEGGYEVDNRYVFLPEARRIYSYTQNSDKPYSEDTLDMPNCAYDLISVIYASRNLNFSGMAVGDSVPVKTLIDNEFYDLYIRYLGHEKIENKLGGTYACIKFSALLVSGTMFEEGENLYAWVTNDANRVPVLVEAKILVGSVKAYLKETHGLRN